MKLLEQLETTLRGRKYASATVKAYGDWVNQYIRFFKKGTNWTHPSELSERHFEKWLNYLAIEKKLSASSQNQAFAAICFFYREVLKKPLENVNAMRARKSKYIPVVLSASEAARVLDRLSGENLLLSQLMLGCGLRVSEACSLRVKDIDFDNGMIHVRQAKGNKDRIIPIPDDLIEPLQKQVKNTERIHAWDTEDGTARVELPNALERKKLNANKSLEWYWLFCSAAISKHPTEGWLGRWHLHPDHVSQCVAKASREAGIKKDVAAHTLRHTFATLHLHAGTDLRTIQKLLGHADIRTTMIYTHVDPAGIAEAKSPLAMILRAGASGRDKTQRKAV
jgi:integron integrase